jgi:hypothetical protein
MEMRSREEIEKEAAKWFEDGKIDLVLEVCLDIREILLQEKTNTDV